jgi:hypothetical protein
MNSMITKKTNTSEINNDNKNAYNIKTIASRHTRHKSMLYNMSINPQKFDYSASSKTIDSKRFYSKPVVTAKKKAKMYYYKRNNKDKSDLIGYPQSSQLSNKISGEYSMNQNMTIDSLDLQNDT